jgi:hypothetical protein
VAGRNNALFRSACRIGQLVGAGAIGRGEAECNLLLAAEICRLIATDGLRQARDTIRSGLDRGQLQPRDKFTALHHSSEARGQIERAAEQRCIVRQAEESINAQRVRRIFAVADPWPAETLAGRYYAEHRGLALELLAEVGGHSIRFDALGPWEGDRVPMVLDAFRDFETNAIVGLRRTRLDPVTAQKVGRKMLGRAARAAIKLSRDSEVGAGLCVAEGTETAIAGMALGFRPMWALGSAGAIRVLPPLRGIEALTICAELDDEGANAAAIEECGNRWCDAGREVFIAAPKIGGDLNEAIQEASR